MPASTATSCGSLPHRRVEWAGAEFQRSWGNLRWVRVSSVPENSQHLLTRNRLCRFKSGVRLQEDQRRALRDFAKHLQGDWIVGFEAGGQLIDQSCLTDNQTILIAGQSFEFLNNGTIRGQLPQIRQLTAPRFRQQVGINGVGLGTSSVTATIYGLGVHWV